jgi:putative FmdB family regulatory protein
MPLYEYQCDSCHEDFEQIRRFSEADLLPDCPICGSCQTHKKISAAASLGNASSTSSYSSGSSCGSSGGFS